MKILLVLSLVLCAATGADLNHVNGHRHFQQTPAVLYRQPSVNRHQNLNVQTQSFRAFQPQQQTSQNFVGDVHSTGSTNSVPVGGDTQAFQVNEQPQGITLNQRYSQPGNLQIIGVSTNGVSISGDDSSSNLQPINPQNLNIIPASLMLQMNGARSENQANDVVGALEVSSPQTFTPNLLEGNQNFGSPQNIQQTYNLPQFIRSGQGQLQQQQPQQENVAQTLPFNLNSIAPSVGHVEETIVEQQPQVSGVFFEQASQPHSQFQGAVIPDPSQLQFSENPTEQPVVIETEPETEENVELSEQNIVEDLPATKPLPRLEQESVSVSSGLKTEPTRCEKGLLLDARGECVEPQVVRNVYLYAAPKQERKFRVLASIPKPKIEYNIVFVRNPEKDDQLKPLVIPPPQQKTLVYVLNQKLADGEQDLIEVPTHPKLDPEVYFVNYGEDENPQLPGGIDLRTALQEMVLEGTVIEDSSDTLGSFVQSVGTLEAVEVEDTESKTDDTFGGFFESVTEAEDVVTDQTEAPEEGYNYAQANGFSANGNGQ